MSDIETRILSAAVEQKAKAWAALQRSDPRQAEWLAAMSSELGKPDAIEIRAGSRRYVSGSFRLATNYPDWRQRLAATLAIISREARVGDKDRDYGPLRARK